MTKLIVFSSYIKNKTHSKNLVQYISTRDGVEYNKSELNGDVTFSQKKTIDELVEKFPYIKEIEEYKNFLNDKSKIKASEFLTEAFGLVEDKFMSKEIYLKYISERPRVEKLKIHGLFNSNGEADLKKEIADIKNHKGVVWTHIVSLKREDAQRLGYDKLDQWQLLLKTKIPKIAEAMNIDMKNLVWNAAFHNEGYHPHVHLVMYSKNIKEGFLKEESIKKIKSVLMNEIYKEDLLKIKEEKTLIRDEIKSNFEKELDKVYQNIITKNYNVDDKLINAFFELAKQLPGKGKNVYGYQSKEVKNAIDNIVKLIVKNKDIKKLYDTYIDYQKQLAGYYSSNEFKSENITNNKEFRKLQNIVLNSTGRLKNEDNKKLTDTTSNSNSPKEATKVLKNREKNELPDSNSIKEKLKKIGEEMEAIKNTRQNNNMGDMEVEDTKHIKEGNVKDEIKEIVELKEASLKNIEDKFLDVFYKTCAKNKYFMQGLKSIKVSNYIIKEIKEENSKVQSSIMGASFTILESPELKEDLNKYKQACYTYAELKECNPSNAFYDGLHNVFNKLLWVLSDIEKLNDELQDDKVPEKILKGANNLKRDYNLNGNLDVKYNEFNNQNKDAFKYMVKDIVFSIADMLYFSSVENDIEKNKIEMRNRKINKMKHKHNNTLDM